MSKYLKTLVTSATIAAASIAITGCDNDSNISLSENKQKVIALLESIETGAPEPVAYINATNYVQHNLNVKDGLAGFGEVLGQLPAGSAKVDIKRVFEYGDYVIAHSEYDFFGPKAGFDVFRFENNLIVEHWDNFQEIAPANASGRTQFDGETHIKDLNSTEENISIVKSFVDSVLIKGTGDITTFISPEKGGYIQHNPGVADDLEGLGVALQGLAEAGVPMIYTQNHVVMGEGNFVLAVSEGQFLGQHVAFYDMFRLNEGMIVEHWDTIETIPAVESWANTNGKFGF